MKRFQVYKSTLFLKIIFVISVAIIFFIGGITFKHIDNLKKSTIWVNNSQEVNLELEKLISYIKDAESGQRGFLITKNDIFLEPYRNSKKEISNSLKKINYLTKNSKFQQYELKKLIYYINKRQNYLSKNLYYAQSKDFDAKQLNKNLLIGKGVMDTIRIKVEKLMVIEKNLLKRRQLKHKETISYTPLFIYLTLLITLILLTIAFTKMNNDLKKLKKSNDQLLLSLESSNLAEIVGNYGCWQLNLETNEYTFSENEYRLLGHEPYSFIAGPEQFKKQIHPDDLEYVNQRGKQLLTNSDLPPMVYRVIRKDGSLRYFKGLGRMIENSSGTKIYIGTTTDITDEVSTNKYIEERNRELEANNKELIAFNYIASHDLQEPLRKIETFISRLVETDIDNLSDSGKQYINRIKLSANRMRILIDDLLQFSRTNKIEKVFEITNLNELLENTKLVLAQLIEEKNAIIESDILPNLSVIPFQIQQLFTNIIGNSIKYSKENSNPIIKIKSKITIAKEEPLLPKSDEQFYKITFEDNGIGFEQEYAKKIFVLFNRLHNKNEYDGTGIGLAICKKIIENHKGHIFADGKPNIGTIITIFLPVI